MACIDNEEVMAWLETSLRYAHNHKLSRLAKLLAAVRDEISLEIKLSKGMPLAGRQPSIR